MANSDERLPDANDEPAARHPTEPKQPWSKPEIASFLPASAAEGISYNPLDGLTNLTP